MTPSQAAQNLREWAAACLDPEPLALHNFYKSHKDHGYGWSLQKIFLALTGAPGEAADPEVNRLADYNWPALCMEKRDTEHYCLFLCFLADVIETDGTDWIQNV